MSINEKKETRIACSCIGRLLLLLLLLLWVLDTEDQKRVSLMGFGSHPRGVEPPSTRQLELQLDWDMGGILRLVQS